MYMYMCDLTFLRIPCLHIRQCEWLQYMYIVYVTLHYNIHVHVHVRFDKQVLVMATERQQQV